MTLEFGDIFTEDEILTLLEFARVAMEDAVTFDATVEELDITDADAVTLREKLQEYLEAGDD